jgi:hypothetical protein
MMFVRLYKVRHAGDNIFHVLNFDDVLVAPATLRRRNCRGLEALIMARSLGRTVEYVTPPIQTVTRTTDSQKPPEHITLSFNLTRTEKYRPRQIKYTFTCEGLG